MNPYLENEKTTSRVIPNLRILFIYAWHENALDKQ